MQQATVRRKRIGGRRRRRHLMLLARPTLRLLVETDQPVCLDAPRASSGALDEGTGCHCLVLFTARARDDQPHDELVKLDLTRFAPKIAARVKMRNGSVPAVLHQLDTNRTYLLNTGALAIMKLVDGKVTAQQIGERLLGRSCVDREAWMHDVETFMRTLAGMELIDLLESE